MVQIRGLTYPLEVNSNGSLKLSTDLDLVRQHILSVLETRPYERVLNSSYGLSDLVFETINPEFINSRIGKAILTQVEEVEDLEINGNHDGGDEGLYSVTILYSVDGIPQSPINFKLQR